MVKYGANSVSFLTKIQYLPGFTNRAGYFPLLQNLPNKPVKAIFSYGALAPNYSSVYFDKVNESSLNGERNTKDFLVKHGFSPQAIQVKGTFEGKEPQIEEVSLETLKEKNIVVGNDIFTRDQNIALIIKPGDCPVAVIYGKDKNNNPLVGLFHSGADATNTAMTKQGLLYLEEAYGVDLSTIVMGVFPSVSSKNFYITNNVNKRETGIIEENWGQYISPKKTKDPLEKRYVSIVRALINQILEVGVLPQNIQVYDVDIYEDAKNKQAYSHRYTVEHNGERPGRQILAVALTQVQ
jgi:copper oxidase (laccase) domain-containing protein